MTRSVVADGQHLAPLDALSGISISTTETIPASCANATDFFNTLLEGVALIGQAPSPIQSNYRKRGGVHGDQENARRAMTVVISQICDSAPLDSLRRFQ